MNPDVVALEKEIKEYSIQLDTVQAGLQADSDNEELQSLKTELEEVIALTKSAIAELKPAVAPAQDQKPSSPPVREKWLKENHPAYQAGYRKTGSELGTEESYTPTSFKVNDSVTARWRSGDGSFYPARITSITGSTTNQVYIVTFKSYSTVETLAAKDIKPISGDSRKRKADGLSGASSLPTPPPPPPPSTNPNVISAAADVDPALATQVRQEPSKVGDGPTRAAKVPRKVKAGKELEAGKSKWQDFTTKGKLGKTASKKDSMFRTPEGFNARVGFTGSGQQMRKDPARSRHIYNQANEEEG